MPRQCEHKGTPQRDGDIAWLWTPPCEPFETVGPNSVPPAIAASPTGTKPGPGAAVNYPGPEIPATARKGLATAAKTLAKYPAATKK